MMRSIKTIAWSQHLVVIDATITWTEILSRINSMSVKRPRKERLLAWSISMRETI